MTFDLQIFGTSVHLDTVWDKFEGQDRSKFTVIGGTNAAMWSVRARVGFFWYF